MNLEIRRKQPSGKVKSWNFCIDWDYTSFNLKSATNQIRFVRYHLFSKTGKPLKTYDITDGHADCDWKEAKPPQIVLDRVIEKIQSSWAFNVNPIES